MMINRNTKESAFFSKQKPAGILHDWS